MILIKSAFAVFVLLSMAACSTLEKIESSPMASELITNQLTLRFIVGSDDPVNRAKALREKLTTIQSSAGTEYTLAELETVVRESINWQKYSLADQELLNFGITKAGSVIQELVGEGVINPEDKVTIDTLFKWIDQAAMRVR